jgi:hypothetical protein
MSAKLFPKWHEFIEIDWLYILFHLQSFFHHLLGSNFVSSRLVHFNFINYLIIWLILFLLSVFILKSTPSWPRDRIRSSHDPVTVCINRTLSLLDFGFFLSEIIWFVLG